MPFEFQKCRLNFLSPSGGVLLRCGSRLASGARAALVSLHEAWGRPAKAMGRDRDVPRN
jgi:hypothetical protein